MEIDFVSNEESGRVKTIHPICTLSNSQIFVSFSASQLKSFGDYYPFCWLIFLIQIRLSFITVEKIKNSDESVWHTN